MAAKKKKPAVIAKVKTKTKTKTKAKTKTKVKKVAKKAAPKKKTPKKIAKKVAKKPAPKKTVKPLVVAKKPVVNVDYSKAITPLADRLVVRVVSAERMTPGGLIIPGNVSQATGYLKAEVLAVGTGIKSKKGHLKPLDVKIGDKVLFSEYSGTKVEFNSEELQIIHESDVMGVVQD